MKDYADRLNLASLLAAMAAAVCLVASAATWDYASANTDTMGNARAALILALWVSVPVTLSASLTLQFVVRQLRKG